MRVRDVLLVNWGLKLTALGLAFILWLAVHPEQAGERTIPVPLEIHNVPRNMVITNERPTSVDVTVRGQLGNLWLWGPAPTCVIDLQTTEEGERVIPVTARNVRIPRGPGLEVLSVQPPRLRLVLERTAAKEVAVRPALDGEVASGYEVYSVTPNPSSVILTGPRSHVDMVREVTTETVSIDGEEESVRAFVQLNILDTMLQSSRVQPVEVAVEIGARRRLRTVADVPVLSDDATLMVTPAKVALQLLVPPEFKGNLTPADFRVTVSARSLPPSASSGRGRTNVRAAAALPPGISIRGTVPAAVTVRRGGSGK